VKLKLALVEALGSLGAAVMVVSGAAVSTVQVKVAGVASTLPAGSVARTLNVCEPLASPAYGFGLVQVVNPPLSSSHSKVEPGSLAVKEKLAEVLAVGSLGEAVMVVFGAPVSTVHVNVAALASVLPAGSVARTAKVWDPSASAL
jgi:hypothetical protein